MGKIVWDNDQLLEVYVDPDDPSFVRLFLNGWIEPRKISTQKIQSLKISEEKCLLLQNNLAAIVTIEQSEILKRENMTDLKAIIKNRAKEPTYSN